MKNILSTAIISFISVVQGFSLTTLLVDGITNVTCYGGSDGAITLSASGGQAPYQFSIDGGATWVTPNQFTGLTAGPYDAMVKDGAGATDGLTVNVIEPAAYTANITATNVSCNGACDGNATVFAAGGTQTLTTLSDQQNTQGCGAGAGDDQQYWQSFTASSAGYLRSLQLKFFDSYGETPQISIREGSGTANTVLTTGNITKASVATCTFNNPVYMNVGQQFTFQISDGSGIRSSCDNVYAGGVCGGGSLPGTDLVFSTFISDFSDPYFYQWDAAGGNGTAAATNSTLCAGTASVTITDAVECVLNKSVVITEPALLLASAGSDQAICEGDNVVFNGSGTGGTPGYAYLWNFGDGNTSSQATPTHTYGATGTYSATFTVTDAHGCNSSDVSVITVNALPVVNVDATVNASCFGNCDGSISVSGGVVYQWDGGAGTNATASGLCAGTYTVTATDANGCSATASATVAEPTALTVVATGTNASCNGVCDGTTSSVAAGGTAPYTYVWDGGAGTNATASGLCAGTYTITVIDTEGCAGTYSYTVTEPIALTGSITAQTNVLCNGDANGSVTVAGADGTPGYLYSLNGGGTTQPSGTFNGLSAGALTVTVVDDNGCTEDVPVTITEPDALDGSITAQTNVFCNGDANGSVTVAGADGAPGYLYSLNGGATTQAFGTFSGLSAGALTVTVVDANGCIFPVPVTITEPDALDGSITAQTNVFCNGDANGSVSVEGDVGTGTPPYLYSTDGGVTTQMSGTFSGLSAGGLTVTIVDANGCIFDVPVIITEPDALGGTITAQTNVLCNGGVNGSVTVAGADGTPGYLYSSDGGATTQASGTFNGLSAGALTVTVVDGKGCTEDVPVTITEPDALGGTITAQTNVLCNGDANGSVTVAGADGAPGYLYSLDGGATTQASGTFNGLTVGSYAVTVVDANGCISNVPVTITEPTQITGSITAQTNASCAGVCDGEIEIAATGGTAPLEYSWTSGSNSNIESNLCAGIYTCTVTDANGCETSEPITVTEPNAIVLVTDFVLSNCGQSDGEVSVSVSGGTGAYTYLWDDSGNSTTTVVTGLSAGTYAVTVTDANGCTQETSSTITDGVAGTVSTIVDTDISCFGICDGGATATIVGGTAPFTYLWNNGETSANAYALCAGTASVDVTDANGCVAATTINISETPALGLVITSYTDPLCNGVCDGTADVTVSGGTAPFTYSWKSGGTTANEIGLCAGIDTVAVTDANGCIAVTEVTLADPALLTTTIVSTDALCNGESNGSADLTATGGTGLFTYLWNDPAGTTSEDIVGLAAGTYNVTVIDANGCESSSSTTITEPNAITFSVTASNPTSCILSDGYLYIEGLLSDTTYNVTLTFDGDVIPTQPFSTSGSGTFGINGLSTYTITDLTIEIGGCSVVDTNVYNLTSPFNGLAINSGSVIVDTASCLNNDGNITGFTVSGGTSPYTYFYNGASSAIDLLNAQPGTYVLTVTDVNDCSVSSAAYTIESTYSNITASVTTTDVSCNGDCDGSVVASATGGLAPYTYLWTNGMSGGSITGVCGGSHGLFITDANGCESNNEVIINEPLSLSNTINTTNPGCGLSDGSAEVTATSGGVTPYSYQWSNGSMLALADSVSSGVYTVTVTDANGCTSIETVSITSSTSPILTSNLTSPSCTGGSNGSIDLTITGGTAPIVFDWSTGESTSDISNLPAGIYDVTIMDASGCGIVEVFTLSDASPIDLSVFSVSEASCGFSDGSIEVTASGGSGSYNYLWSSGGSTAVESNLSPGTYTLSVSDANGCLAMANYTVSNESGPVITLDQVNEPTCQGGSGEIFVSVSGGVTPYTYSWNNGSTVEDLLNAAIGEYELIVTDSNGCIGVEYAELEGVNLSAAEICMVTVDTTTGSNIVIWNKEQNLGISEYEIYKETSSLNVFQLLGTVPFDSLSQFYDTAANSSIHSYRYKLRTLDSCSNASEFLAYHKTIHLASNIGLNNVVNLAWDDYIGFDYSTFYITRYHPSTGWEVLDSVAANVHSYTDNTYPSLMGLEYGIEVVPNSPCLAEKAQDHNTTRSNRASIMEPNDDTGIDEVLVGQISIRPNPTNGIFTLCFDGVQSNRNIEVFDLQGKLLLNKHASMENKTIAFDISEFETGMYLIKISSKNEVKSVRLIKQ